MTLPPATSLHVRGVSLPRVAGCNFLIRKGILVPKATKREAGKAHRAVPHRNRPIKRATHGRRSVLEQGACGAGATKTGCQDGTPF